VGNKGASVLFNYRNSNLVLLDKSGLIDFDIHLGVPTFNDFSLNLNVPTKLGNFSFFGLGGLSDIVTSSSRVIKKEGASQAAKREAMDEGKDTNYGSKLGVAGLTHQYNIGKNAFVKTSLAYTHADNYAIQDTLDLKFNPQRMYEQTINEQKFKFSTMVGYFLGDHQFQVQFKNDWINFGFDRSAVIYPDSTITNIQSEQQSTTHQQASLLWKYAVSSRLKLNAGLYAQRLSWNSEIILEPRFGLEWLLSSSHMLSAGFGKHSQTLPFTEYFYSSVDDVYANLRLKTMKSNHIVLGHKWSITDHLSWTQEVYFQDLFDIPVSATESNSYSMINNGVYENGGNRTPTLVNDGKGRNYGLDMTLEYNQSGYSALISGSVFRSEYAGSDGLWRSTAWDAKYTLNAVIGKQIVVGRHHLGFNIRNNLSGGQNYASILERESLANKTTIRDFENDFSSTYPNYYKLDIRIGYGISHGRFTHEMALDLQNVTGRKNLLYQTYSPALNEIKSVYQLGFIPVFEYTLKF
jgi:hypothetical protein